MRVEVMGGRWPARWRCSVIIAAALALHLAIAVPPVAAQVCVGDCGGKGSVGISDLILGVDIALGTASISQCPQFDANKDGMVQINEIIAGVNNALSGQCSPAKTPTGPTATRTVSGATPTRPGATPTGPAGTPTRPAVTPTGPGATATPTVPGGRFVDNHDGTITDTQTGLMWEKKVGLGVGNPANLHNATNTYTWAGQCASATAVPCQPDAEAATACAAGLEGNPSPNGCATCQAAEGTCTSANLGALATIWDWLVQLNAGSGFAGHTDWRIPTESELATIVDFTASTNPPVDPAFQGTNCGVGCTDVTNPACSCTSNPLGFYVSASARTAANPVWGINYPAAVDPAAASRTLTGSVPFTKNGQSYVRAVRGGSFQTQRFTDNGDGTITDQRTNLTWEKKVQDDGVVDAANLHDADDKYAWSCTDNASAPCQPTAVAAAACSAGVEGNGSACGQCAAVAGGCSDTIWTWLAALNAAGFAGHSDWRIPTVEELQSMVLYTGAKSSVDPAFEGAMCGSAGMMCPDITLPKCSCTNALLAYWSATTSAPDPASPWEISFEHGSIDAKNNMTAANFVRAVRGGN